MTSKSNQPKQQQQPQQNNNVNQFVDFLPGFAKRKEIFNKAPALRNGVKFPYIKEPLEIAYEKFISEVANPKNSKFYPKTDEDNRPITMPDNVNCKRGSIKYC